MLEHTEGRQRHYWHPQDRLDLHECDTQGQAHLLSLGVEVRPSILYASFLLTLSSVQFSHSVVSDSATPWTAARQASLSITNSQSLLKLMSIEPVMPSNHLILCCPLLLLPWDWMP